MENKKTIIYIMSDVRSGSTLLENVLSNAPGVVSVGELRHLDAYLNKRDVGKVFNWKCSCSVDFVNCEFWTKVFDNLRRLGTSQVYKTAVDGDRSLLYSKAEMSICLSKNKSVVNHLDDIYKSIFSVSNADFIVDSSKNEVQLASILKYSKFKIKVIFLKRDVRAVVMSKKKWQKKLELKQTNLYVLLMATKLYFYKQKNTFKNHVNRGDGLQLDYDELSVDLYSALSKIIDLTGIKPFTTPVYMEMHKNHSVGGTPNREKRLISYDSSWRSEVVKRPLFRLLGKVFDVI